MIDNWLFLRKMNSSRILNNKIYSYRQSTIDRFIGDQKIGDRKINDRDRKKRDLFSDLYDIYFG